MTALPASPLHRVGVRARLAAARAVERSLDRWASWAVLGIGVGAATAAAVAHWLT